LLSPSPPVFYVEKQILKLKSLNFALFFFVNLFLVQYKDLSRP
jgi:hypothetical protein